MAKLTVDQFTDQINSNNLDYALSAEIITDYTADRNGLVVEAEEKTLCTGNEIYNFMQALDEFDGVFDPADVLVHINIMNDMK